VSGDLPARPGRDNWVSLIDGVRVSRTWMTLHTPRLLAAWREARSAEERHSVAVRILRVATALESDSDDGNRFVTHLIGVTIAERIDPRLVQGPDWPPLAAALDRAAAAGYDVVHRLPVLAAAAPLPDRHPARELHWRLLDDWPAALPPRSVLDGRAAAAGGRRDVHSRTGSPHIHGSAPSSGTDGEASIRARTTREGGPP
jgi:hypothetical protein